ncbi:DUF1302 domain-containing protein [uncultured Ferrimonas sp.]|uniref:DUF1302 domain-containing protein n=1 Tax=uncultured Ferrimonas sp. TaxID=432640 RepID=UPI0026176ABB|nr:DUF1302 domain-containing protein [uncultured Ferrimonas sp.]
MFASVDNKRFKLLPLTALISIALSGPVAAATFEVGDYEVIFDSNISIGSTWRTTEAKNIALSNGGFGLSSTSDDGTLNYDKGDATSQVIKGIHDLGISNGQFGAFTRFKYWYDYVLAEGEVPHGHVANGYAPNQKLNEGSFDDFAQASGFELLDAFVYGEFELGDMPLDVRVGRQVLSWGENTFIFNSINSVNPIDVTALRRPGAEVKEALLPVGMAYFNLGVTENLSIEGFYNWEWDSFKIDGCGTFFSNGDVLGGPGCDSLTLQTFGDPTDLAAGLYLGRRANLEQDGEDSGQWGAAVRYFAESIDTDVGVYYMNITSRTPLVGASFWETLPFLPGTNDIPTLGPGYYAYYPEDVEIMAMSFSTTVGEWSVSGEWSYRPDTPVQINSVEIFSSSVTSTLIELQGLAAQVPGLGDLGTYDAPQALLRSLLQGDTSVLGAPIAGHEELDVHQLQFTTVKFFDQVMGANRLTFVGEVGANFINDLPGLDEQRFGRSSLYGKCYSDKDLAAAAAVGLTVANGGCEGLVTDSAWGYRARLVWDYSDAFAGVNLVPTIAWSHDVDGYSPNSNFIEDRRSLGISLGANYLSKYNASISYTNAIGGDYNPSSDRDYLSVSLGVSF